MQFDIDIPYTTKPKMRKYLGDSFNRSPDLFYIKEKQKQLDIFGSELHAMTAQSIDQKLVEKSCKYLGLPIKDNIKDFSLLFEEDVAIMHNGKLSAICFCFPSSWIPSDRIGKSLFEIHQPVADNQNLLDASEKISKTICDPVLGKFKRQVWTITTNSQLSNHPKLKSNKNIESMKDLYFRLETQVTEPLGDGISNLFFVKVNVIPLIEICKDNQKKIIDSINTMSDAIIEYKNLREIKRFLNQSSL